MQTAAAVGYNSWSGKLLESSNPNLTFQNLLVYFLKPNILTETHHLVGHVINPKSSRPEFFCKKGVLKIFAKFT